MAVIGPGFNFAALFKLIEDVAADLPTIEAAVKTIEAVAHELAAGKMPTSQQITQLESDVAVVVQLVADIKAVIA